MSDIAVTLPQLSNEAHIYLCRTDGIGDPALLERYHKLLDLAERSRLSRFRFERDRHAFLVSHALVRTVLSLYAPVPPEAWRFTTNKYGRPEVDGPSFVPPLRFNLSHTRGLAACVVTRAVDAGIDVEARGKVDDYLSLASRFFAPPEVKALRATPARSRTSRFLSTWTLKESYIKARGVGLSLPLDRFSFQLKGKRIGVHFDPDLADRPVDWSFTLMRPTPEHWLAVAVCTGQTATHKVIARWFIPLLGMQVKDPDPIIVAATERTRTG